MTEVTVRRGRVFQLGRLAGVLEEVPGGFRFAYDPAYLGSDGPPVSLALPKRAAPYESPRMFAYFSGVLCEGDNRKLQCRALRIDEEDELGLLLATGADLIGSVTVEPA